MIRRILPLLALVTLFGACSSGSSNAPDPGAPSMSRGGDDDGGGRDGRRGRGGQAMGGPREDMLLRGITLSADQREKVQALRATYRTRMQDLRQQGGGDREATRAKVEELMVKQQAELRALLTDEQKAQYDRNVAEMRDRVQRRGGARRG